VIAIHCKNGTSRSGLYLCSYLLFDKSCPNPDNALSVFAKARTFDLRGIRQSSHKRYVKYFDQYLNQYRNVGKPFPFDSKRYQLTTVRLNTIPTFNTNGGCDPYLVMTNADGKVWYDHKKSTNGEIQHFKDEPVADIMCSSSASFFGDVRLTFFDRGDSVAKDIKIFSFWLNAAFIQHNYMVMYKDALDGRPADDKDNKEFNAQFKVELFFKQLPSNQPCPTEDEVV